MNQSSPLITIGLPIYNAEATLRSAVRSIIAQTYQEWVLLLLDDGSNDASYEIAQSFKDDRIIALSDGINKGISSRLNQAVAMTGGKYFCRMDADDIAFPDRIKKQVTFLEHHPEVDVVAASIAFFRNDGKLYGVGQMQEFHSEICKYPWRGFHFFHPTWLGKTAWFKAHPYASQANGAEDQLVLYSACRESCFAGIPEVLLGYREERRSFKKMFGRRKIFWQAIAGYAIKSGQWSDLFLLSLIQPLKIVADFLNTELGMDRMRNRLDAVDPSIETAWQELWEKLRQSDAPLGNERRTKCIQELK